MFLLSGKEDIVIIVTDFLAIDLGQYTKGFVENKLS